MLSHPFGSWVVVYNVDFLAISFYSFAQRVCVDKDAGVVKCIFDNRFQNKLEQFEINDSRSLDKMYKDIADEGLQPVLNDYLYV